MIREIAIDTNERSEMIDITDLVQKEASGIDEGIVTVYVSHTTAGITINENADPDVQRDILWKLERMVPKDEGYKHMEGNSDSHIKTLLTGSSAQVIVKDGRLVLGTWQSIFFCEYDGPRRRKVMVHLN